MLYMTKGATCARVCLMTSRVRPGVLRDVVGTQFWGLGSTAPPTPPRTQASRCLDARELCHFLADERED